MDKIDLSPSQFGKEIPFEQFAQLRSESPVYWYTEGEYWVVSTYELVRQLNRDYKLFSSRGGVGDPKDPMYEKPKVLLSMDPPEHSKYRRAVNTPFTPMPVARLEEMIRKISREAIHRFVEGGGGDFVTEVAAPVPFRVIASLLGIPREDEDFVFKMTNASMPNADPEYRSTASTASESIAALDAYAGELLADRRLNPRDDLVTSLVSMKIDGEPIPEEKLRSLMEAYITGGSETTRHLLSHGLVVLLTFRDQLHRFSSGEVNSTSTIEEMLRWSPPVMQHSRWPSEAFEVGGKTVQRGDRVTLWMVSANRDESVFDTPDSFDVGREPNPHTSFGSGGPHFCLGVHLARLESVVFFEELVGFCNRMELDGRVERLQSDFLNGLKHVPIGIS